jgi:hypothetical protein
MRYFQLALLVLLFSLKSCGCKNKDVNNNSTQRVTENSFLLGLQLQHKKFQDIFTDKEIQELNLVAETPIILEQDEQESIYQIRVLNQKGGTCGCHAIRNCVWLMKALNEGLNEFSQYYFSMLNEKSNEEFQQSIKGLTNGPMSIDIRSQILKKIENKEILGLPEESEKYIKRVTLFNFTKEISSGSLSFISPQFKEKAKEMILKVEDLNQNAINKIVEDLFILEDIACFSTSSLRELYNLALDLSSKSKVVHAFDIIVGEEVKHGISVVINKVEANIEYILVDSINANFKTAYNQSYWQAIKTLKELITHREYFSKNLLRRTYTRVSYTTGAAFGINSETCKQIFRAGIDELSLFNLKGCELYKKNYRKHFIDLITKYKLQHQDEAEIYDQLLAGL